MREDVEDQRLDPSAAAIEIAYATLEDCHLATGLVVVVDVIRAFTTAAHVFDRGAQEIWPVAAIDEAFALRERHPRVLLIGEEHGVPVPGFDAGNSPSQLDGVDFAGRTVVQRTSAGTQGIARSARAERMLAASFVCAGATARAIRRLADGPVTFVVTGVDEQRDGEEDRACADYLAALVRGETPDHEPYLRRARASSAAAHFTDGSGPPTATTPPSTSAVPAHHGDRPSAGPRSAPLPAADLDLATELDRFDFALRVTRGERTIMRPA